MHVCIGTCTYACTFTPWYICLCQSWPGLPEQWQTRRLQLGLEPNMTTGAVSSCPGSSSSQCRSSTRVCRMCVRNTITFSTQADVFVALQPANIGSFSSPLFPHLLKESHLFRCLLRSFFHSFCLNRHIVLSQHSSSQPGQNQLHRELSWTWPVIWGTRGQSDGKKTDQHRQRICVGLSG